jgi:predicted neuraminidase
MTESAGPIATRGRALVLAILVIGFGAGFIKSFDRAPAGFFQPRSIGNAGDAEPRFETRFVSGGETPQTHAASLVELNDGGVRAFWLAGSREGATDVEIHTAVFHPGRAAWRGETPVASRAGAQRSLRRSIRKLGNPVAVRAADGRIRLFYVTISVGGWGGSSVTMTTSADDGKTWTPARRLITTPFFNLSTLVKGTPFLYDDGTLGVPVYHELIGKFGELLRLDKTGAVIDKQRLSSGNDSLQPVVLAQSDRNAIALMRYAGGRPPKRVLRVSTDDAGRHWSHPEKSALSNPDAALSGVVLADGRILVVLNDIESDRDRLSLVASRDGGVTWKIVITLEDQTGFRDHPLDRARYLETAEVLARDSDATVPDPAGHSRAAAAQMCRGAGCGFEFSYPYLIQARDGEFHLVYTWNRSFIKHVRFNQAWLDRRPGETGNDQRH